MNRKYSFVIALLFAVFAVTQTGAQDIEAETLHLTGDYPVSAEISFSHIFDPRDFVIRKSARRQCSGIYDL